MINNGISEIKIDLLSLNATHLKNLPGHVFLKDMNGDYTGYNDYGAKSLGYQNGEDIIGKNDFDLFPSRMARLYQSNDKKVVIENKSILVEEIGQLKNNFPVIFLSHKMPLYDKKNHIAGVIGIAFVRSVYEKDCPIQRQTSPTTLENIYNICADEIKSVCNLLSEQEKICLKFLSDGMTIKQIAKRLSLSPKTVETYIERAKIKMNCHNRIQLILLFSSRKCCSSTQYLATH